MIKGKTKTGFEFEIDEKKVTDYRFIQELGEADENFTKFPRAIRQLLGKEQEEKLTKHVADENDYVDIEKMAEEFIEIITLSKDLKNS